MIYVVIIRSSVATFVAWLGILVGALIGSTASRALSYLVTAALGALLAVTLLDILPDARRLDPIPVFLAATASGALLFFVVARYVYPICPACSMGTDEHTAEIKLSRTVILLSVALGIHSMMDGAAVVIGDSISHGINPAVFFAVSLHKFPEGLALVLLLIGAGLSKRRALIYAMAVEATTELGALGALLLVTKLSPELLGMVFANIGGGFLYLVLATLVSQIKVAPDFNNLKFRSICALSCATGFVATCGIIAASGPLSHL